MGKVSVMLPGEENLNATKSKEVNILFLRRDGVDGDKTEDRTLMRTVTICHKDKRDTDAEGLHHTLIISCCVCSVKQKILLFYRGGCSG